MFTSPLPQYTPPFPSLIQPASAYCVAHQITNLDLYCGIVLSNSIPSHANIQPFVFPLSKTNVQFRVTSSLRYYIIKTVLIYVKHILTISEPCDIWFGPPCSFTFQFSQFIKFGRDWTGAYTWNCLWFFCFKDKKEKRIFLLHTLK